MEGFLDPSPKPPSMTCWGDWQTIMLMVLFYLGHMMRCLHHVSTIRSSEEFRMSLWSERGETSGTGSNFIFLRLFLKVTWWLRDGFETKLSLETSLFFLDLLGQTSYSVFSTTKSIMGCFLCKSWQWNFIANAFFLQFHKIEFVNNPS